MDRRSALNRIVLGVTGLALLAGGGWLAGTGRSVGSRLPGWWPVAAPGGVLLDRDGLAGLRTHGWWLPAVVCCSLVPVLLLVRWCAGRVRSGGRSSLRLPSAGGAVRSGALADALARRTSSLAGVSRCRVDVRARRARLHVRTRVWLAPDADPAEVLAPLAALRAEAEESAAPYRVVNRVRISARSPRSAQVR
ncbi:hypothetical protein ACFVW8_34275 [Streptomyces sp. NPDC058221]|uniref:hypothetical protein n=1 Tax=Streptomyces sp. NPDC058221 TaxID=3346388 RepID=UPI0036F151B5